jgi:methanogenic corrinoid protein MtbC1
VTASNGGASTQQRAVRIGAEAYAEDANDRVRKTNALVGS